MWWLCQPPPPSVCWHDGDILVPTERKKNCHTFYPSFIIRNRFSSARVARGGLEPIPAGIRQGRSTPRTSHQFITGLTYRDKQPSTLTFTLMGNLVSPIKLHVFGLWEEAGIPAGNPRRHRENMQTPRRKVLPQLGIELRTLLMWGNSANH